MGCKVVKGIIFIKSLRGWVKFKVKILGMGFYLFRVRMGGLGSIRDIEIILGFFVMSFRGLE